MRICGKLMNLREKVTYHQKTETTTKKNQQKTNKQHRTFGQVTAQAVYVRILCGSILGKPKQKQNQKQGNNRKYFFFCKREGKMVMINNHCGLCFHTISNT